MLKLKNSKHNSLKLCDRCGNPTNAFIMSQFNTQDLCMKCSDKERKHKTFKQALDAEIAQIKKGNYNFKGIGLPRDLK